MRSKKLIQLYLTNRCNSKCRTCPIWKCKEKENLPLALVRNFISEFKDADFVYGGGEFFLYPWYKELLEWSEANDIKYTILTNGLLPEKAMEVASAYASNFTISWDGIKHDKIRGVPGNNDKIKELLGYLRVCKCNIKLSYTFSKYNYDTIDEDMRVAKEELGMDKLYLALGRDTDTFANKDESVSPKDFKPLMEHLDMFYDKDVLFLKDWNKGGSLKDCTSTRDIITVYSNGDIPLCQGMESDKVWGNILKDDIKELKERIETLQPVKCPYKDICYSLCQRRYDYEV